MQNHRCYFCVKTLDMKEVYTEEELQRFEAELRDKEEELRRKKEKLQEEQELLQERGRALEAQRREYQQVTCEILICLCCIAMETLACPDRQITAGTS